MSKFLTRVQLSASYLPPSYEMAAGSSSTDTQLTLARHQKKQAVEKAATTMTDAGGSVCVCTFRRSKTAKLPYSKLFRHVLGSRVPSSLPVATKWQDIRVSHSHSSLRSPLAHISTEIYGLLVFFTLLGITGVVLCVMGILGSNPTSWAVGSNPAVDFTSVAGGATILAVAHKAEWRSKRVSERRANLATLRQPAMR